MACKWRAFAQREEVVEAVLAGMSGRKLARKFGATNGVAHKAKKHILRGVADLEPSGERLKDLTIKPIDQGHRLQVDARGQGLVMTPEDLVREAGVDMDKWSICDQPTIKSWPMGMKGPDGEPVVVRLWGVTVKLQLRHLPVADLLPRAIVPMARQPQVETDRLPRVLFISDAQIGFRRTRTGQLVPMHDRRALDLLLQIATISQPERIVWLGDNVDLAEWSTKFPRSMDLVDTTSVALAELRWWLVQFRAACPMAFMDVLGGNHDARIWRALREKLPIAETLAPVGSDVPALAMERLLDLKSVDAKWYPYTKSLWIWDQVEVTHGTKAKAGSGQTITDVIKSLHHSFIQGHIHRNEQAWKRVKTPKGARLIFAASPGCTTRIVSGAVPGATDFYNWQQAWGETFLTAEGQALYRSGIIHRGHTVYGGVELNAVDHTATIAEDLGIPMAIDWLEEGE